MKFSKKIITLFLVLLLWSTSNIQLFASTKQDMIIEFIDVGAGDSIYIETPDATNILIDGGTSSQGKKIVNYLRTKKNTNTLDYVISTHPDSDHVGGLTYVFETMSVKNLYYPKDTEYITKISKEVINLAKKQETCLIKDAMPGSKIISSGATIEFIQSNKNYSSDNEDSVMTYINYGTFKILLSGDVENSAEYEAKKYNVDILQVPHHGSKYSSSTNFISSYDPEKIIISTDGKKYGHPSIETLDRYKSYDKNIEIYRTDVNGNIKIYSNGSKYWINTDKFTFQNITTTKARLMSNGKILTK